MRAVLLSLVLLAQAPVSAPQPAPLTEVESAKVRALNLEVQRVNLLYDVATAAKEKADHAAEDAREHIARMKAELESARPGWIWDSATGQWTPKPKG